MNCDHYSPAPAGIIDGRFCLSLHHIAFVIKMVNKENVKIYLNTAFLYTNKVNLIVSIFQPPFTHRHRFPSSRVFPQKGLAY